MSVKRRRHSPGFKFKVALEAAKEQKTISQLSSELSLHPTQISNWKKQLLDGAQDVFGGHAVEAQHVEHEVEKLHAKVGQLTMENDFLSKFLGRDR